MRLHHGRSAPAAGYAGAHASACTGATAPAGRVAASAGPAGRGLGLLAFRAHEHVAACTFYRPRRWRRPPRRFRMNDDRAGRRLPIIHRITDEENGPFQRQHLDLEFSNGERRRFERLVSRGHGAVVVVPMLDDETVLLVREYAAGMHRYELGLVKGRIDAGETPRSEEH